MNDSVTGVVCYECRAGMRKEWRANIFAPSPRLVRISEAHSPALHVEHLSGIPSTLIPERSLSFIQAAYGQDEEEYRRNIGEWGEAGQLRQWCEDHMGVRGNKIIRELWPFKTLILDSCQSVIMVVFQVNHVVFRAKPAIPQIFLFRMHSVVF